MTRLVIVADNSLIVEAIRVGLSATGEFNLLGRADARTTSAATIARVEPDLVLLDDMGQSERAIELIREIRTENAGISVIVLTTYMGRDWLARIFGAGATTAISKATNPGALATLLRETLNGHIVHGFDRLTVVDGKAPSAISADELLLTSRELEILHLVAAGLSNRDVGRRLWVTEQTVKFHLRNVYRKLNVTNRTEASHFAHVNGLVSEELDGDTRRALTVA